MLNRVLCKKCERFTVYTDVIAGLKSGRSSRDTEAELLASLE